MCNLGQPSPSLSSMATQRRHKAYTSKLAMIDMRFITCYLPFQTSLFTADTRLCPHCHTCGVSCFTISLDSRSPVICQSQMKSLSNPTNMFLLRVPWRSRELERGTGRSAENWGTSKLSAHRWMWARCSGSPRSQALLQSGANMLQYAYSEALPLGMISEKKHSGVTFSSNLLIWDPKRDPK